MVFGSVLVGEVVQAAGGELPDIEDGGNNFRELGVGAEEVMGDHGAKAAVGSKDKNSGDWY